MPNNFLDSKNKNKVVERNIKDSTGSGENKHVLPKAGCCNSVTKPPYPILQYLDPRAGARSKM